MNFIDKFKQVDPKYSATPLWFWNGKLDPQELKRQIDEMVDKGVYGAFMHARAYLNTQYLEDDWWQAIQACIDEGKKKGFKPWLYDEYAWPSGTAGSVFKYGSQKPSRVLAKGEVNMAKGLIPRSFSWNGDLQSLKIKINQDNRKLIATYIILNNDNKELKFDRLDNFENLANQNPKKIVAFYRNIYPAQVDYLNKDTIKLFISLTHEEYAKRYQKYFGNVIPGIFFDEIYMIGNPIPWTDSLPDEFKKEKDYDLLNYLPYLVKGDNDKGRQVRQDYFEVIAKMYETTFFKQIGDWCHDHNLKLIGHTEEDISQHPYRQGNYFDTMRHLDIPGADNHDYRYKFPRIVEKIEPKHSVSVARMNNKERAMTEAMGGAGWGCSLQQFRRGLNILAAMGINMFIPHGFYYECNTQGEQADWPTTWFFQNPYWKYFKKFADYISRISYMNTQGKAVVDIGILYPITSLQRNTINAQVTERSQTISQQTTSILYDLLNHQVDADMVDMRHIESAVIKNGRMQIGNEYGFKVLVAPSCTCFSQETITKLNQFTQEGGHVIFFPVEGDHFPNEGLRFQEIESHNVYKFINKLFQTDITIHGDSDDVYVNHRISDSADYYFIANTMEKEKYLIINLRDKGNVYKLNPENGEQEAVNFEQTNRGTKVYLKLTEDEACFLVVTQEVVPAVINKKQNRYSEVVGNWQFLPLDKSFDNKWSVEANETKLSLPLARFTSELSSKLNLIRIQNTPQELGNVGRHLSIWKGNWITRRISWNDQMNSADLFFRKIITLKNLPKKANFSIAAIDEYTIYINGHKVIHEDSLGEVATLELNNYWKIGDNLLAVHIHTKGSGLTGDPNFASTDKLPQEALISLLLQGDLVFDNNEHLIIASDDSFIVNDTEDKNWNQLEQNFESEAKSVDAMKYRSFNENEPSDKWLFAWKRGVPPLLPFGPKKLFGKDIPYPVKCHYDITLPVGTKYIFQPAVCGNYSLMLDGQKIVIQNKIAIPVDGHTHCLGIDVLAKSAKDGLQKALNVIIVPVKIPLVPWSNLGLSNYSGRVLYQNDIQINLKKECQYVLDLGRVDFNSEIWINDKLINVLVWEPYRIDVTNYLHQGNNHIAIVVANSAANERRNLLVDEGLASGWDRYWNRENIDREPQNLSSGLLGPVRLYEYSIME